MRARLLAYGSIEIDGRRYDHDVIIERGGVRKRSKKPSKPYRDAYGHTPLQELVLGGVTRTLLRKMTRPVLMSH